MAFKRIKDWLTTITAFRRGDFIAVDGPSGSAKMSKDSLLQETAQNALASIKNLSTTYTTDTMPADAVLAVDSVAGPGKATLETVVSSADSSRAALMQPKMNVGGFWRSSTSQYDTSPNWSYSDPIDVTAIKKMYVTSAVNTDVFRVAFFDELPTTASVPLDSSIAGDTSETYELTTQICQVPAGAKYAIISSYSATGLVPSLKIIFSTTDDKLNYESSKFEDIYEDIYNVRKPLNLNMKIGGFWFVNKRYSTSVNWSWSDPVDVSNIKRIEVCSAVNQNVYRVAFFEDFPTYQSVCMDSSVAGDSSDNTILTTQICQVPAGAKYAIISSYSATGLVPSAAFVFDTIDDKLNYFQNKSPNLDRDLQNIADVNLVIIYGQSLSIGADTGTPISTTCKYPALYRLGTAVNHREQSASTLASMTLSALAEVGSETPASGCAEKLIEYIQKDTGLSCFADYWNDKKFVFVSCGKGATSVTELSTGTLISGLYNVIDRVAAICEGNGWTMNIPAMVWIQGETDQKYGMSKSDYKTDLTDLLGLIDTKAKAVTSQTNDVQCLCYQTCSGNTVFGTGVSGNNKLPMTFANALEMMAVPTAQMELVRDSAKFSAVAPTYMVDHNQGPISSSSPANIHLTNVGSKMLGALGGLALKRTVFAEAENNGVMLNTISVSGNTITLKYDVETLPLKIDTSWVKEVEHYGYKVLNSSNQDIIQSVSVYNDSVEIVCTENPVGCIIVYGFNGDDGYDGRMKGGRGNICDSSRYEMSIAGKSYAVPNYAYCFAYEIT